MTAPREVMTYDPELKPRVHELKTWPEPFQAMLEGRKRFELRKDDRGFAIGDVLHLLEWDPAKKLSGTYHPESWIYTGRKMRMRVTYIMHGGRFGLPADLCVMGIEPIDGGA